MSHIHLVGGEKGGVGKSLLAQLLCQWFIEHAVVFTALDADSSHGALLRGYGDWCRAVDLSDFESTDLIMDAVLSNEQQVVVDLPAQSFRSLARWLGESNVVGFAQEMTVELVYWYVTDGGVDSMKALTTMLSELAGSVRIVVVCNHRWSEDFSHVETSGPFQEVRKRGGAFIELPRLDPQLVSKTERHGGSLRAILDANLRSQSGLSMMEQRRVAHFRALVDQQLEPILRESTASPARAEAIVNHADAQAAVETAAVEPVIDGATAEPTTSQAVPQSSKHQLSVGTKWIDGAATWTEVSETGLVHHVRYR